MKLLITVAALLTFTAHPAFAREQFRGQYAQIDVQDRAWFRAQTSPKTGISCCSEADGTYAEEDIRDGHYWTRFVAVETTYGSSNTAQGHEVHIDWMQVPDDVVIKKPNKHGAPTVWYYFDSVTHKITIRCYAVGANG